MSKTTLENLLDMLERSNSKKKTADKPVEKSTIEPTSPETPGALTLSAVNDKLESFGQQIGALLASVQQLHAKVDVLGTHTHTHEHAVLYETNDTESHAEPNEPVPEAVPEAFPDEPDAPDEPDETDTVPDEVPCKVHSAPSSARSSLSSCSPRVIAGHIRGRKSLCMLPSDTLPDFMLCAPASPGAAVLGTMLELDAPVPLEISLETTPEPAPELETELETELEPELETELDAPSPAEAVLEPAGDTDTDTHATAVADAMSLEESYIIRIREEAELAEQAE